MTSEQEFLYRFEFVRDGCYVYLWKFRVLEPTPRGFWIEGWGGERKFVLRSDEGKRFAYETKEQAWKSFRKRKQKYVALLQKQLQNAKDALELAEKSWEEAIQPEYEPNGLFAFVSLGAKA